MISTSPITTPRRRGLVRDRDFRWFWAGQTLSFAGSQVTAMAMPLVAALTLGAGPAGVSLVATASFLPNLALPLLVGHVLEARSKRPAMIASDALRAVVLAGLPVGYALDVLSLPLLVAAALVVGVANVIFEIAGFAYLPALVPVAQLGAANRAMQGSSTAAQVAGPGLAGLLVQLCGAPLALLVDAVSYVASAVGIRAARRAEPSVVLTGPRRIFDGFRLLMRNPYLRAIATHAAIYNAGAQIFVINLVIWVVREQSVSPGQYGLALSAGGLGAFAGAMLGLPLAARLGFGRAFAASLLLSCGIPLFTAAVPARGESLAAALALLQFGAGVGLGSANVLSATLRQTVIPAGEIARTNGAYRNLNYGAIPLGSAAAGVIGETLGSRSGVAVGTVAMALSALPMMTAAVRSLPDPHHARPAVDDCPNPVAAST